MVMWEAIDWKRKYIEPQTKHLEEDTIHNYFKKIFNSSKNSDAPKMNQVCKTLETYNCENYEMDKDLSTDEVNKAIQKLGTGVGIDGISPEIFKILPHKMRNLVLQLMQMIFDRNYPKTWRSQLLLPYPKKGHCISDPKLRGIGIGPGLSRIYDILVNARFCNWYTPNREQAGFREKQGPPIQLFTIYLLLDYAEMNDKEVYIIFMDYEKAFDYVNRALLIEKMMQRGAGHKFVKAVHKSYEKTSYLPKLTNAYTGAAIETDFGVTQGKTSSSNYFSMYVSDMAETTVIEDVWTFLVQLADDTAIVSNSLTMLISRFRDLLKYSDDNYQHANMDKTKYMQLSKHGMTDPIHLDDGRTIHSCAKKGYQYIGAKVIASKYLIDHVLQNIKEKKGNVVKFYHWLDNDRNIPFTTKILVFYSCVLPSILHGCETWWVLDFVSDTILEIEREGLRRILGIKKVPYDLIHIELNRPDIISCIKDRQHKFFYKISNFSEEEALAKEIMNRCTNTNMMNYFRNLNDKNRVQNVNERVTRARSKNASRTSRYMSISDGKYSSSIYDSNMLEEYRILITRWRFSCFDLAIETGRYSDTPANQRICTSCNIVEDENHVFLTVLSTLVSDFGSKTY